MMGLGLDMGSEQNTGEKDYQDVNYLDSKVNIFAPSTPFMREHLRIIWVMFVAWAIVVFGPVTATFLMPEIMTGITIWGFPLHYFLTAVGAPSGALILSIIYARKRDLLDEKYEIHHSSQPQMESGTTSTERDV